MGKTLTIRLDSKEHAALGRVAKRLGKTVSAVVRETLREGLAERPLSSKSAHLRGRLRLGRPAKHSWRAELKARNWRS